VRRNVGKFAKRGKGGNGAMPVRRWRSILRCFVAALACLAAGCFNFGDVDRHAKRLEVRPTNASMPVGRQLLLIATVYDENDNPRRKRRVEWLLEGPGNIVEVDDSGHLSARSSKVDNKYAVSYTDFFEHNLPKGIDNALGQVVHPGQTWCVVSSAVEGQTVVTAYAPEIADSTRNRVMIKAHWVDARWQFPQPVAAKAGTEQVLATQINRQTSSDPVSNYRVRYTILDDGPAAGVYLVSAAKSGTPRTVTAPTDADGVAKVSVAELKPEFGTNRIGIEIMRSDANDPNRLVVVSKSETRIDWQAPQVRLSIDAPQAALINHPLSITYAVGAGAVETVPMMVKAVVPDGWTVVSAEPKATQDGNDLLWSLPALPGSKQQTVQAVFRPTRTGRATVSATVRAGETLRDDKSATLQINEGKLDIALSGPQTALVSENLPYQITVKNPGSGTVTNAKVSAQFDAGLELAAGGRDFSTTIEKLDAGQMQTIALALVPKQAGRSAVKAVVSADGNLGAESPAYGIDVKKADLKVEVFGPQRGYINQEATWTVRVFNPSDLAHSDVKAHVVLPAEVTFRTASNDGKFANGAVDWTVGTAVGKQWTDLTLVGVCNALTSKAVLTASVSGVPLDKRDGEFKPVALNKPVGADQKVESAIEILGVPALHIDVSDSADPVQVGQSVTYTIRVKNTGTLQVNQVEVSAEIPPQLKPVKAFGAATGKIDGQKVSFSAVASIQAGLVSVFTIEAQAVSEGDARFAAEVKSLSLASPIRSEEPTRVLPKNELPRRGP
jgi:uncharacterized repeat protein (TIGR01451 family)